MPSTQPPSLSSWQKLYEITEKFFDLAPWQWMSDSDVFGVRDPETGIVNFCCIMGQAGQHYALAVYLGDEGLKGYLQIATGVFNSDSLDALHAQICLMISFQDKSYLMEQDRLVIKQLGLKFRDKNSWPVFRDYDPGFMPWLIDERQARILITATEQAIEVALRFQNNPDLFLPPGRNVFFARTLNKQGTGQQWRDEWVAPKIIDDDEPDTLRKMANGMTNTSRINKIKTATRPYNGTWEIDYFYSPMPVDNSQSKPFFPRTLLCVDRDSFFIFGVHMLKPNDGSEAIREEIINIIEKNTMLPRVIAVKRSDLFALLHPLAVCLNIAIELRKELPAIADARHGMNEFFRQ
jgi:hypothetical protein